MIRCITRILLFFRITFDDEKEPKRKRGRKIICKSNDCGRAFSDKQTYLKHILNVHIKQRGKDSDGEGSSGATLSSSAKKPLKRLNQRIRQPITKIRVKTESLDATIANQQPIEGISSPASNLAGQKENQKPSRKVCHFCGKIMGTKALASHLLIHTNPAEVTCKECGKLFSSRHTLKKHYLWTHSGERPFLCDICGRNFKRKDHVRLHFELCHPETVDGDVAKVNTALHFYECEICQVPFHRKNTLEEHVKRKHKVESYSAVKQTHKVLDDQSFECRFCGLNFKLALYLRLHVKFVHVQGMAWSINQGAYGAYKCEFCDKRLASSLTRKEHYKRVHKDKKTSFKFEKMCDHCGVVYTNKIFYSKHCAKLSGKPTCYLCWESFETDEQLKEHQYCSHVEDLPFGCEVCYTRFAYLTELRTHTTIHTINKQFQCEVCHQGFGRKDQLKSHYLRHYGVKQHGCEYCGKLFVRLGDLRKHRFIHTRPANILEVKKQERE